MSRHARAVRSLRAIARQDGDMPFYADAIERLCDTLDEEYGRSRGRMPDEPPLERVMDLWAARLTISQIAMRTGYTQYDIRRLIDRNRELFPKRKGRSCRTAAERAKALRLLAQGRTVASVARAVGCSESTVRRWRDREGGTDG